MKVLTRSDTHEYEYSEEQELGNDERRLRPGGGKRVQRWNFLKCLGDQDKGIEVKGHGGTG